MSRVRARPPVFLANLGALSDYNAQAGWAKNFFAAGGIEALDEGGFTDTRDAAARLPAQPGAGCVHLRLGQVAGLDGRRSRRTEARRGASRSISPPIRRCWPSLSEADKRAIDRIVYDGCNMLKTLTELHHMMRVKELGQAESEDFDDDEDHDRRPPSQSHNGSIVVMSRLPDFAQMEWTLPQSGAADADRPEIPDDAGRHSARARL